MKGGEKQINEKKYDDEFLEKKMKEYTLKFKDNFVPEQKYANLPATIDDAKAMLTFLIQKLCASPSDITLMADVATFDKIIADLKQ